MYIQTNTSPHAKQIQYKLRPTDRQTQCGVVSSGYRGSKLT